MTRIITAALVALVLAAPAATAMPTREDGGGTSSQQLPGPPTWPVDPQPIASPDSASATDGDDGTSPLVYILPGVIVSVLLVGGTVYAVRTSRWARLGA
jgi:hypothetical protein